MLALPPELTQKFESLLQERSIPDNQRSDFHKWLRFYLDFCDKYRLDPGERRNFSAFAEKLRSKNQPEARRQQAKQAIAIYYRGILGHSGRGQETMDNGSRRTRHQCGNLHGNEKETQTRRTASLQNVGRTSPRWNRDDEGTAREDAAVSTAANLNHQNIQDGPADCNPFRSTGADWVWVYDRLNAAIKVRHYSPKTLQAYRIWTQKFQTFTKSKDARLVSMEDVKNFLTFLAIEKNVAASSQNQAFNALLFLFKHVLEKDFGKVEGVVKAKRRAYIPVVLSRNEVDRVFSHLEWPYDLVAKLLYGCGLRLFECLKLRIQDLNFDMKVLTVHDGKGQKDRTLPLPVVLMPELEAQRTRVMDLHNEDLASGYAGTFLPNALAEKYKNASTEFAWQWLFPAKTLTLVPENQQYRRYHLHETHVQKAIKQEDEACASIGMSVVEGLPFRTG